MTSERLGVAIIGTGAIARRFAADMRYSKAARVVGIGARDPEKARALAVAIGSETFASGIEEAMASPRVGVVYVATANDAHAEHALLAIRLGKAVLVEKPLAVDAAQAETIARAARSAGVFAMEAMWARFTPGIRRLKSLVAGGDLGDIRRLHAEIAYRRPVGTGEHPAGALLDLGVYPISLAEYLLGPSSRVLADGRRVNGVVARAELLATHGEAFASLSASWDAEATNRLTVVGTGGIVEAAAPLFSPPVLTVRTLGSGPPPGGSERKPGGIEAKPRFAQMRAVKDALRSLRARRLPTLFEGSGLHYQVEHMAECLRSGMTESPVMPLNESCRTLQVVDAALSQIG